MLHMFKYIGLRQLRFKPGRTALTTLGITLGIALFSSIQILNESTLISFKESIDAVAGKTALTVSAGSAGFPEDRLEIIKKIPGVKFAVPMIETRGDFGTGKESVVVLGIDLLKEQSVRTYKTDNQEVIEDPLEFLNQPDSIILTHVFAEARGLKIGSHFELATALGLKSFTVRGLLSPEGPAKAYGGNLAIMDIDGAQVSFGKQGRIDRADLVLNDGAEISAVSQALRSSLGTGYQIESATAQYESRKKILEVFQGMLTFFSSLSLAVGLVLVLNSVSISVAERKREIGTLRALGATRSAILQMFIMESAVMGLAGSFLGIYLGRVLASLLSSSIATSMSAQFGSPIRIERIDFHSRHVLGALVMGTLATILAAAWPAFRASRIPPLLAMKKDPPQRGPQNDRFFNHPSKIMGAVAILTVLAFNLMGIGEKMPALRLLESTLAIFGAATLGPSTVLALMKMIRPLWAKDGSTIRRLAMDNLLHASSRTSGNILSLMVGLILVVLVGTLNQSFQATMSDWVNKTFGWELVVSSNGNMIAFQSQPLNESIGQELAAIPGVKKDQRGLVSGMRFIQFLYEGRTLGMKAIDEPLPSQHYSMIDRLDGPVETAGRELFSARDNTVMVSENFVLHFGKKTGDRIRIDTPSGPLIARIVAVVRDFANNEGVIYISRELYKSFWKDPLVNVFLIDSEKPATADQVRLAISEKLGKSRNLLITSNSELRGQMLTLVDQGFALLGTVQWSALLVGLLGLLNTMLVSVLERTRELGMMRAIGMSAKQLSRMIMLESLLQGILGALAALFFGIALSALWIHNTLASLLGWKIQFHLPVAVLLLTLISGAVTALLAGLYPARRAANLQIREALEYE